MNINKIKPCLLVFQAFAWALMLFFAVYKDGMYVQISYNLVVLIIAVFMVVGTSHKNITPKKMASFIVLPFTILWLIAVNLTFSQMNATEPVMGFHPSFAAMFYLYWIGGTLLCAPLFVLFKDEWLDKKTWDDFVKEFGGNS